MIQEERDRIVPFLVAKVHPPGLPDLFIRRPAIELQLKSALREEKKVLYLSAPPGYGKTSTLALLAAEADRPHIWLTLDMFDNAPGNLAAYLARAVREGGFSSEVIEHFTTGSAGTSMTEETQQAGHVFEMLSILSAEKNPFLLFLDNLHEIENKVLLKVLEEFIYYLPHGCCLAIATREDIPLPLWHLRNCGNLIELRQEELKASEQEMQQFLALSGVAIQQEVSKALLQRLGGWWSCLRLFSVAWLLRPEKERSIFAERFRGTERFIAEFLLDSIYTHLSSECSQAASLLAVPDFFNEDLAQTILGPDFSPQVLQILRQHNLLIISDAGQISRYRFHPLLRDYFRYQLSPSRQRDAHLAAADWFDKRKFIQRAARHREYALKLLSKCSQDIKLRNTTGETNISGVKISSRELDLLEALEAGLSNEDIGEKLFISTGTVKWHLHNIYEKLDARSRTEAIRKAHLLGIL